MCMDLTLGVFFASMGAHPALIVILILVIGVTVISGATDAPNAIATAVSTRCLKPGTALALAAVFNFAGLVGMTYVSTAVAHTMFNMVDFSGETHHALMALIAAMIGSIGWGFFCWWRGIPASKSHSLIAGITGGAIAMNGLAGVVIGEWVKVIYGMVFSLVAGFIIGWLMVKLIEFVFRAVPRRKANQLFVVVQDICAAMLSFLHGSQDGQKFMSIALLGMVKLEKYQGVAASLTTVITLLVSSLTGMPVSTSHCSTAAIMGVGASKNPHKVKWSVAKDMVLAWVLTFPCCGFIGWALAKVFMLF